MDRCVGPCPGVGCLFILRRILLSGKTGKLWCPQEGGSAGYFLQIGPAVSRLLKVIRGMGGDPAGFEVEVAESAFIEELGVAVSELVLLREAGLRVSLDDLGTGYSSLNLVKQLPLDYLKLDRTLVQGLEVSEQAGNMVRHVILIARGLGIQVITEGVETEGEMDILRRFECDYIQGFGFAKPMDRDSLIGFLAGNSGRASSDWPPAGVRRLA